MLHEIYSKKHLLYFNPIKFYMTKENKNTSCTYNLVAVLTDLIFMYILSVVFGDRQSN